jgi:hypothetical protein
MENVYKIINTYLAGQHMWLLNSTKSYKILPHYSTGPAKYNIMFVGVNGIKELISFGSIYKLAALEQCIVFVKALQDTINEFKDKGNDLNEDLLRNSLEVCYKDLLEIIPNIHKSFEVHNTTTELNNIKLATISYKIELYTNLIKILNNQII